MARNNHTHLQLSKMDHIQPKNGHHNEPLPLGQKLLVHRRSDAPLRIGPSTYGSMALGSNDLPSSSCSAQWPGYRVGNPGTAHASFVQCPSGSSTSRLPEPALSYPHRSEEGFAPVSSHLDNRRAALKRKTPIIHPVDGTNAGGYYVGSSSNTQLSNYMQPNPSALSEPVHPQMPSIDQSGWEGQQLIQQEGFQRNVRAHHSRNISLEPRAASTYTANNIYPPSFPSTASASPSTSVQRNQAPVSVSTSTVPSGAPGITSRALMGPYYPAVGSSSSSAAVPAVPGSSGSATFANGGCAPRAVHNDTVPILSHPASVASSGSRAMPHETVIRGYPPATSRSMRIGQPFPTQAAASSRYARHVAVGHANNGRNRRARSSYYGFHPSMIEAVRIMMLDQLVFYESREAADPHRDMRLDVDNMSYEDLLALGEFIGNVNTGLADEKISDCVKGVVCCSSDPTQNDQDDGSCAVCLEDYKDKDLLGVLKCNHDFHADCIKKWLRVKNSCPVCKAAAA